MKNPYQVLNISQDATNADIVKAQALAMRSRLYTNREIAEARAILAKPTTRLASDFTFTVFPRLNKIEEIKSIARPSSLSVEMLNADKYDSLK